MLLGVPADERLRRLRGHEREPAALDLRFTARDGSGGDNAADTTLMLAAGTGPFRVTSPTGLVAARRLDADRHLGRRRHGRAPISTANVKITLSIDGGHTYPYVLAASRRTTARSRRPAEHRHDARTHEGRGGRQRLLRRLERRLRDHVAVLRLLLADRRRPELGEGRQRRPAESSLGGDRGLAILADGYPASVQVDCVTLAPIGSPQPTASDDGLTFSGGQYSYIWKTSKSWGGTCRQLQVLLVDGTLHTALFSFK